MVYFFISDPFVYALKSNTSFSEQDKHKLSWLFGQARCTTSKLDNRYIGNRISMVTPWSTNAVEITQNMNVKGIERIERFVKTSSNQPFDPMTQQYFESLNQEVFKLSIEPEPIKDIKDIERYNKEEGLALSKEEVNYLLSLSKKLGRLLTDSEVFGFSQVNSEHCRHKIFNGTFIIDGKIKEDSLFKLIKKTSAKHPNTIVSAYNDNVAFIEGPEIQLFSPKRMDKSMFYAYHPSESVISIKAETHNFPTTVEPFSGAATGIGGEIRDRLAGGKGSLPLSGAAVYMTSYPRLEKGRDWEEYTQERKWLYQSPTDILIKASNGASDFGNKFGQPLITGSVFTFEHNENNKYLGYDKTIMLAAGVGFAKKSHSKKEIPNASDRILVLGGDNYRIGMGGAAVSSTNTGNFELGIELNAIQRSNPEMQKRVSNTIRAMVENSENPIISIHDHGAGGHLNCLSELVGEKGGHIDLDKLPVGDPTLSAKEIIGNESQERMGLIVKEKDKETIYKIAQRERCPIYDVGEITKDQQFTISSKKTKQKPLDFAINDLLGNSPKTIIKDNTLEVSYKPISNYDLTKITDYVSQVLQLEAVACKDWLTNKVDRCVSGLVAKQQCIGELQIPLNNVGVVALDYTGSHGIATSIGHSPISGLITPSVGSKNSIAEALTNIIWAPLQDNIKSISLSANWMWACNNKGEDARLYKAVQSCSDFVIELGINIPTGKDSLSMTQKYPNDKNVIAPGTVIIYASGHCEDIKNVVEPVLQKNNQKLYYINLSSDDYKLGGSSFGQILGRIGTEAPDIKNASFFKQAFNSIQKAIKKGYISSGHDISSGGLITALLEMCFASNNLGAEIDISALKEKDTVKLLFAENSSILFQADKKIESIFSKENIDFHIIGEVSDKPRLVVKNQEDRFVFDIPTYRDLWFNTSYLLDKRQSGEKKAKERKNNLGKQPLVYHFPKNFKGIIPNIIIKNKPKAAVIREQGSNSEREMANSLYVAGFEVKDIHMTDLISGKENLKDIQFIGAVGGFSNSDVLGSAKGWAGSFLYNDKANKSLLSFFARENTLSLGVCNGCQLFIELGLITPKHDETPKMLLNDSNKLECIFSSVEIQKTNSVMMQHMEGAKLGIWSSHGEGKFNLPKQKEDYNIVATFGYQDFPANPNGSDYNTAMLASADGRHLVSMPHFERSLYPWNWAYYPKDRKDDDISPWGQAFVNARDWLIKL